MKRLVFSILMILALATSAAFAQSTINTTPPGPTQQQSPGLTNNNLPNPGNPQTQVGNETGQAQPVQEEGTVEGTATESINNEATGDETQDNTTGNLNNTTGTGTTGTTGTMNSTGSTGSTGTTGSTGSTGTMNSTGSTGSTGLTNETETGTGADVDVDTGANASGAMDVDVNSTTDADTDASGVNETGSLDNDTDTLPSTASALPLLGLVGLLALAGAFAVRRF
jgi:hypothetical protein